CKSEENRLVYLAHELTHARDHKNGIIPKNFTHFDREEYSKNMAQEILTDLRAYHATAPFLSKNFVGDVSYVSFGTGEVRDVRSFLDKNSSKEILPLVKKALEECDHYLDNSLIYSEGWNMLAKWNCHDMRIREIRKNALNIALEELIEAEKISNQPTLR